VITIEVSAKGIRCPRWAVRYAAFLRKALKELDVRGWEVSVLLCGDALMKNLNRTYRGKNAPTDVLSFRQADSSTPGRASVAGDVIISLETLRRNAAEYGTGDEEELKRLGVHGLLHLAGMDHGNGRGGAMLRLQGQILDTLAKQRIFAPHPRR
jgi:probable rRNA maturation factor